MTAAPNINLWTSAEHSLGEIRDGTAKNSLLAASSGIGPYEGQALLQWGNYLDHWRRGPEGWRIISIQAVPTTSDSLKAVWPQAF